MSGNAFSDRTGFMIKDFCPQSKLMLLSARKCICMRTMSSQRSKKQDLFYRQVYSGMVTPIVQGTE